MADCGDVACFRLFPTRPHGVMVQINHANVHLCVSAFELAGKCELKGGDR